MERGLTVSNLRCLLCSLERSSLQFTHLPATLRRMLGLGEALTLGGLGRDAEFPGTDHLGFGLLRQAPLERVAAAALARDEGVVGCPDGAADLEPRVPVRVHGDLDVRAELRDAIDGDLEPCFA